MARASTVLVQGRVGIVDAALVRWLRDQKNKMDHLAVCITQSVYEPVVPKSHLEEFLSGLGIVDAVLQRSDKFNFGHQQAHLSNDATLVRFPEDDLLDYSIKFICKRRPVVEGEFHSKQLTTLDGLCKCYGSRPPR